MKKNFVFGIGVICSISLFVFVVVALDFTNNPKEKAAKAQMEAQKEVQRKTMKQQLLAATRGDLVEQEYNNISAIWSVDIKNNEVWYWNSRGQRLGSLDNFSGCIKRVIKKSDPDYPAAAARFFNQ